MIDAVNQEQADRLAKEIREVQEQAALLRRFKQNEGWVWYEKFMQDQIQIRRDQIELAVIEGMDGVIARSHLQAELSGLRLAAEYVDTTLASAEETEAALKDAAKVFQTDEEE